jgi:hypothetical protein
MMAKQFTYTITYGDVAENHARMQKIGSLHESGYSLEAIMRLKALLETEGVQCELVPLHQYWEGKEDVEEAYVMVMRKGVQHILKTDNTAELIRENDVLTKDKHALMRGRVVNKIARWNLCFADYDQEPAYEDGKGRIVAWEHIPLMSAIRARIADWTQDVLLNGEANYYYDISKCGIGFHGDAERRKVFAVRMGASMPLYFQWYHWSQSIGQRITIPLHDGDMYIMSSKAVGFDWLKKKTPTLRHATGSAKYVYKK